MSAVLWTSSGQLDRKNYINTVQFLAQTDRFVSMYRHEPQGLIWFCLCMFFFFSQSHEYHWLPLYDWQAATVWVKISLFVFYWRNKVSYILSMLVYIYSLLHSTSTRPWFEFDLWFLLLPLNLWRDAAVIQEADELYSTALESGEC